MITGHPTGEMLRSYATGTATDGIALLVATHLTYCPACRRQVAEIEAMAAAMLDDEGADPVSDSVLAAVLDRLDEPVELPTPRLLNDAPGLPRPLAEAIGSPLSDIRWRKRLPGVAEVVLRDDNDERVSLIRVRPGSGVPAHTHTAVEATLVLQGSLLDGGSQFAVGDVSVATDADDHTPRAGMGEDCICLTVLGGSVRFTGTFGRALNLFAE